MTDPTREPDAWLGTCAAGCSVASVDRTRGCPKCWANGNLDADSQPPAVTWRPLYLDAGGELVAYAPYFDDDEMEGPSDGMLYGPDLKIDAYLSAKDAAKAHGPGFGVLPLYAGAPIKDEGDDDE